LLKKVLTKNSSRSGRRVKKRGMVTVKARRDELHLHGANKQYLVVQLGY